MAEGQRRRSKAGERLRRWTRSRTTKPDTAPTRERCDGAGRPIQLARSGSAHPSGVGSFRASSRELTHVVESAKGRFLRRHAGDKLLQIKAARAPVLRKLLQSAKQTREQNHTSECLPSVAL